MFLEEDALLLLFRILVQGSILVIGANPGSISSKVHKTRNVDYRLFYITTFHVTFYWMHMLSS